MYSLNQFRKYYKIRDIDSFTAISPDNLQIMIEDYIMHLKSRGLARSTVSGSLFALESFLDINDIQLRWKKIRRLLPAQNKRSGRHAWTTEQVKMMLEYASDARAKALVHFLASTGVRIGALPELKLKHLREMPYGCKAVCVYPGDKEEYWTFLTPEAVKSVDEYLKKRTSDGETITSESPLFRMSYVLGMTPAKPLKRNALATIVYRILYRCNIHTTKDGKRKDVQTDHGFRKRFNTIMKTTPQINSNLVEKMMGHSVSIPLDDSYLDASLDKLFDEFKKAIPYLTVDSSARKQAQLDKVNEEKTELQKKVDEIEKLKELRKQDKDDLETFKEEMMDKISQRILRAMSDKNIKIN